MTRVSDEEIQADSHLGLGENSTTSVRICSRRSQTTGFVFFCPSGKRFMILFQRSRIGGASVYSQVTEEQTRVNASLDGLRSACGTELRHELVFVN